MTNKRTPVKKILDGQLHGLAVHGDGNPGDLTGLGRFGHIHGAVLAAQLEDRGH